MLTKRPLKANGHFNADSVFLIKTGACTAVEDVVLHLERELGHVPNMDFGVHKTLLMPLWMCGSRLCLKEKYPVFEIAYYVSNPVYGSSACKILSAAWRFRR